MYTAISYIIFLITSILGARYISLNYKETYHPLNKGFRVKVTGVQYFFLFTLYTGILQFGGLSAVRLAVWIVWCLIAIFYDKNKPVASLTVLLYVAYLVYLVFSILFSPAKLYGFRVFLKYLYPFLVLLLATQVTTNHLFTLRAFKNIFYVGIFGSVCLLILYRIPIVSGLLATTIWWGPAILDFMPVVVSIALAYFAIFNQKKYLRYIPLFILPAVLMTNRTGMLAISITIAVFSLIKYKLKSVPYVAVAASIFIGVLLYVPEFREKMFYKKGMTTEEIIENRDALTSEDIDSSGRFSMWEWSLDNFYKGKELTGSGLGNLQQVFYSHKHPFGHLEVVHNDYVQILCDTGLIGLVLYASIILSLAIHSILIFYRQNDLIIKFCAIVAASSMAGLAVAMYTDNVVNYSLMTLSYPFAIYGMLIGLKSRLAANN